MRVSRSPTGTIAETAAADGDAGTVEKGEVFPEADEGAERRNEKGGMEGREVTTLDEDEDPKQRPKIRKWIMTLIICLSSTCVTYNSSIGALTEAGIMADFHISKEVSILTISFFVIGLGLGPLLLGPLSEFYGRWKVYVYSYTCLFGLTWGVAFAPNVATHFVMRFLSGFSGAAFLSVAGGSIGDMWANHEIAYPMVIYTMSPFLGPASGPLVAGFINQNASWRWTYWSLLIWEAVQLAGLAFFVPETYEPVLLQRKAAKLRRETRDESYYAEADLREDGVLAAIVVSCYRPFDILFHEPMALLIGIWTAFLLGILYLAFQAFPIIFGENHGFSPEFVGLSFVGLGLGIIIVPFTQPFWNRVLRRQSEKHNGKPPPETRLIIGCAGAVLTPISVLCIAFTSYSHVHWIAPIIASIPFGTGIIFVFTAAFTYLVVAYRRYAASAMAGNTFLRSCFAAGFPLFADPMFERLTPTGALGLLAGLLFLMVPLPFLFYHYGERIRKHSRFATA